MIFYLRISSNNLPPRISNEAKLNNYASLLNSAFKNQSDNFKMKILTCVKRSVLRGKEPSIVFLVSEKSSANNAKCVVKKLFSILNED